MYYKYFIEFLGTLVILYANISTYGNPSIMAISYFAVYTISEGISHGYFSPLTVFIQYSLGKISMTDCLYYLTAQYVAAISIILTFIPLKTFINNVL